MAKEERRKLRYYALIHGVDIEEEKGVSPSIELEDPESNMLFRDPKDYDNMTEEERQSLTEKMDRKYKRWASKTLGKGGK